MNDTTRPAWADINEVTLQGRLGRDPESRSSQSGQVFVNFSLATSEVWKDKQTGERREKTTWHNVAVKFNDVAVNLALGLRKGQRVKLVGKIAPREWQDAQGQNRTTVEIEVGRFGRLEIVPDDREGAAPPQRAASPPPRQSRDTDDEIPF